MKLENFPPRNRDAQKKEIENIKNIQKERIKIKDKSILDDLEFWELSLGTDLYQLKLP